MEIGVQISSVRKFLQTPQDVLSSFVKSSQAGYEWIQIQWISLDVPPEFIRDALSEARLKCVGTQDYTHEVLPRLDEVVRWNDLWGGDYVCVSGIPPHQLSEAGCSEFGKELAAVAKRLADRGKVLQFHPRVQDIIRFDGRTSLDILLDCAPDNFQMLLDIYHVQKAGYAPSAVINALGKRVDMVHFKDYAVEDGNERLTPVGQGIIDWESVFDACVDMDVKWCFAEQERWDKDPFECLKESYDYIAGIKNRYR